MNGQIERATWVKIALMATLILTGLSRAPVATLSGIPAYMARVTLQIAPSTVTLRSSFEGAGALGRRG